jgi:hypothetical protein
MLWLQIKLSVNPGSCGWESLINSPRRALIWIEPIGLEGVGNHLCGWPLWRAGYCS